MNIEINGKTYKLNTDLEFGLIWDLQKHPDKPETTLKFIKEVLSPTPKFDEIRKFKQSDITKLFRMYNKIETEVLEDSKKKRSR